MNRAGVTVVIPVRDGARYIQAALDSVAAQDVPVAHVVVVDDGSTDASAAVAAGHRLQPEMLSIPPSGIAAARNRGIAAAQTAFVAFLDADDLWTPTHNSRLLAALAADPGLAMAFGHAEQFASPELSEDDRRAVHVPAGRMAAMVAGGMVARRAVFDQVGLFEVDLRVAEFVSWLLRARDRGLRHVLLPDVVLRRRLHASNVGRAREDDRRLDYVRALRSSLARRRASETPA